MNLKFHYSELLNLEFLTWDLYIFLIIVSRFPIVTILPGNNKHLQSWTQYSKLSQKSSKIGQDWETLKSASVYFLTAISTTKNVFLERKLGTISNMRLF